MKKHLRILYGCDDRYEITTATTKVCEPYFDDIAVLNAGPHEFYDKLAAGVSPKTRVIQFQKFFEMESCRRCMMSDVPVGDWVLWLDADERPSKELLKDLDKIISDAEESNINTVRLIWAEHTDGVPIPVKTPLPETHDEALYCHYFMSSRLIKKEDKIKLATHWGAHEIYGNVEERAWSVPYLVHHMKSFLQYKQSVTFSGFLNPFVHYNCSQLEKLKKCLELPAYKKLREFQIKHKVFTSNDLVRKLKIEKDAEFKAELIELVTTVCDKPVEGSLTEHEDMTITFRFMKMHAEEFDMECNSPHYPCGRECCNYNGIQL